ncbi:MAG: hypothetical protein E6J72_01625 [Deltaproteobacteria bacterium]|nr:MAG: hypothetical protein E6J72_01625 [Deltaproteobacteria bacterium]
MTRSLPRHARWRRRRAWSGPWTRSSVGAASSRRSVAAARTTAARRRTEEASVTRAPSPQPAVDAPATSRCARARRRRVRADGCYRVRRARVSLPDELLAVDAVLARADTHILQSGARTTVGAVTRDGAELVLKRFHEHTLARVLETLALGSGAARAWRGAARLADAGFEAPEIVAVLERRRLAVPIWSCVAFADWVRRLHAAGIYPQDLRAANVLVPAEEPPRFVLVDVDRVRRYRRLSWRRRRKNLVQLARSVGRAASLREHVQFLRRYLTEPAGRLADGAPVARRLPGEVGRDAGHRRDRDAPPRGAVRRIGREIVRHADVKDAEYARRRSAAAAARARSG